MMPLRVRSRLLLLAAWGCCFWLAGAGQAQDRPSAPNGVLTPSQTAERGTAIQGTYAGVGAALKEEDGVIVVAGVTPKAPADRAGLVPGSTVLSINGISTARMKVEDAVKLMRGAEGTALVLDIRDPAGRSRRLDLVREKIVLGKPDASMCAPAVGLVRLTVFNDETGNAVQQAVADLRRQGATALVLDLRGAGGGPVSAIQQVAGLFLPPGSALWMLEKADGERQLVRGGTPRGHLDLPLVVLVDRETQAAELVAAAIKRNRRGSLVGHKTSGSAASKAMVRNPDGSSHLVPFGTFLLSPQDPITGAGVAPDTELPANAAPDDFVRAAIEALRKGP